MVKLIYIFYKTTPFTITGIRNIGIRVIIRGYIPTRDPITDDKILFPSEIFIIKNGYATKREDLRNVQFGNNSCNKISIERKLDGVKILEINPWRVSEYVQLTKNSTVLVKDGSGKVLHQFTFEDPNRSGYVYEGVNIIDNPYRNSDKRYIVN